VRDRGPGAAQWPSFLSPLIAWRIRCSFSTSAKRT
jgi:hypothetical protein